MRQITFHWLSGNDVQSSGEALPNGRYAVSLPGIGIATPDGTTLMPPGNPAALYVRLAEDGETFACQGSKDDLAWEWSRGVWTSHGQAFGPKAVIYKGNDLHVVRQSADGPVGYRYVRDDGTIVTAAESYADARRGLFEWTEWPDVAIGQGDDEKVGGGVVLRFANEGGLRRLAYADLRDRGRLRDITAQRDGNDFAIAVVDYEQHLTTITWATLAELRAMKPITTQPEQPPPDKEPPVAAWPLAPNKKSVVAEVMAEHQEINLHDEVDRARILPHIIQALGGKPWGRKATNKERTRFNTDAIAYLRPDGDFEIIDVIANGKAFWGVAGSKTPTKQGANGWWAEQPDIHEPDPDPVDPDPVKPPLDDLAPLLEQLRAAIAENNAVIGRLWDFLGGMDSRMREMQQQVSELQLGPTAIAFPVYKAKIFGQSVTLTPVEPKPKPE